MKNWIPLFAATIFFISAVAVDYSYEKWKKESVLEYDVLGYHHYLPATLIYHDITRYRFMDSVQRVQNCRPNLYCALWEVPGTNNRCNQYPMGVSLFQLPFFIAAHVWAVVTKQDPANGYSPPY